MPGEKKTLDVLLADGAGKPVAGKSVQLMLGDTNLGAVTTAANGHATLPWTCPDLPQRNFTLTASYAGDATTLPSKTTANLLVVKAMATFAFENMTWGTYKNEPGAPYGAFIFTLTRTSDGKRLEVPVTMTMNGKTGYTSTSGGFAQISLLPLDAKTWTVKLQYDGDAYTQSAAGEHTYTHP